MQVPRLSPVPVGQSARPPRPQVENDSLRVVQGRRQTVTKKGDDPGYHVLDGRDDA